MAKWFLMTKKADFEEVAQKFHISPPLARMIRNRDVVGEEAIRKYLYGDEKDFYDPYLLKDMGQAVSILVGKIEERKKIRIIGDYDADGICATYILYRGLKACGGQVDTVIPHRIKDGYGLNSLLIEEAGAVGVDTIITCDNGIAAYDQVEEANALGMTVIVTDHHEVPYEEREGEKRYLLPRAAAVVDPKQEGCTYPFAGICGATVAFKLVSALIKRCPVREQDMVLRELLEVAAFATICDVMELKDENRLIVKSGLKYMKNPANPGIKALMDVCGLTAERLSAYHIGFVLGPCINATGRLDTAVRALSLFTAESHGEAVQIAAELQQLNESRKQMTADWTKQAMEEAEREEYGGDKVLVIYLPECHESLAGIIAGRLREKYVRPVFILTDAKEEVKGSGRSVEAYHMYEEMSVCKDLFIRYGGHKMAAGLSMEKDKIKQLRERLNAACKLSMEDFEEKVSIDIALPLSYLSNAFVEEISLLEPFGAGNPRPVFAQKNIRVLEENIIGRNKNVGKYKVKDETGEQYEMMYFGDVETFHRFIAGKKTGNDPINITYYPSINRYAGRETLQIVMQHYQ